MFGSLMVQVSSFGTIENSFMNGLRFVTQFHSLGVESLLLLYVAI